MRSNAKMKILTQILCGSAALQLATAHTLFTNLFIDGADQGDGTCIRMPMTPSNATDPIRDLSSADMACGYGGTVGVGRVCPVHPPAKLSFEFRDVPNDRSEGSIEISHKGPCALYMKPVPSAIHDNASGVGWFKLWEEGYDNTTSQWCSDKIIQNNGTLSVAIPGELAGGYYLVRTELLALHEADKKPPDPQFYVGCAQIFLNSTGLSLPSESVNIPGYTNISDPSVLFNIYTQSSVKQYTLPGPAPFNVTSSNSIQVSEISVKKTQTEGLLPGEAIAVNANWWALELDSYMNEDGCWNASSACYNESVICYDNAPPTGSPGCRIWEDKCYGIQQNCKAERFTGPPNKGQILTPGLIRLGSTVSNTTLQLPSATDPQSTTVKTNSTTALVSGMPSTSSSLMVSVETLVLVMTVTTTSDDPSPAPYSTHQISSNIQSSQGVNIAQVSGAPVNITESTSSSTLPTMQPTSSSALPTMQSTSSSALPTMQSTSSSALPIIQSTSSFALPTTTHSSTSITQSSITSSSAKPKETQIFSPSVDGKCGAGSNSTCSGSTWGPCCSIHGQCGNDEEHCGPMKCQAAEKFGNCAIISLAPAKVSQAPRMPRRRRHQHGMRRWRV